MIATHRRIIMIIVTVVVVVMIVIVVVMIVVTNITVAGGTGEVVIVVMIVVIVVNITTAGGTGDIIRRTRNIAVTRSIRMTNQCTLLLALDKRLTTWTYGETVTHS